MFIHRISIYLCLFILSGCSFYTKVPIDKVEYKSGNQHKDILIVMLRGFGGDINYFSTHNWIKMASSVSPHADFVAPDAHYGYYANSSILQRLHEDIILPAKRRGYREIWLIGISMGGMGSILYSNKYPEDISRIYFFAPYLGDGAVQKEIRASAGLQNWEVTEDRRQQWQYEIWLRLKAIVTDPKKRVKVFIGYGDQDHLDGHDLLAQYLPQQHSIKISGGHKDVIFAKLWKIMLERGLLNQRINP